MHDLLKGKNLGFEFRDGAIIVRGESVRLDDQKIKSRTIKGIVRDKTTGDPLPGATVKIKGTSVGTATNMEGKFELTVADNFIALEVSFIGYGTVEVTVGKREQLEVLLEAESSKMDEVVVTGVIYSEKGEFYRIFPNLQGRGIKECRESEPDSEFEGVGSCFCCIGK